MKRIALFAGIAFALAAPAFAQDAPQNPPVATTPTGDVPAPAAAAVHHSTTKYHGPHKYAMHTKGRAGDPKVVDHSADTLVVEPTSTTVTVPAPATAPAKPPSSK